MDAWLKEREAGPNPPAPSTSRNYRTVMEVHVGRTFIRDRRVTALTSKDVSRWLGLLKATGMKPASVAQARKCLSAVMAGAVRDGYRGDNPVRESENPKVTRTRLEPPTPSELEAILTYTADTKYAALFRLAVETGIRQGELLGLTWGDLRDAQGQRPNLYIHRTLDPVGRVVRNETKTRKSTRTVYLGPEALLALRGRAKAQADEKAWAGTAWADLTPDGGLIFTTKWGRPMDANSLRKHLRVVCERSGVNGARRERGVTTRLRWHDLRHGYASKALAMGVPLTTVSQLLGHESIAITADLYGTITAEGAWEASMRVIGHGQAQAVAR
jgi:integrase